MPRSLARGGGVALMARMGPAVIAAAPALGAVRARYGPTERERILPSTGETDGGTAGRAVRAYVGAFGVSERQAWRAWDKLAGSKLVPIADADRWCVLAAWHPVLVYGLAAWRDAAPALEGAA